MCGSLLPGRFRTAARWDLFCQTMAASDTNSTDVRGREVALAFFGAYLLARELGASRGGGFVAGAAFAYAPWRLEQDGHLHVLSSGGIPLALFLLVRGYRRGSAGMVVAGWAV